MTYYLIITCLENNKQLVDEKESAEIKKMLKEFAKTYNRSHRFRKLELVASNIKPPLSDSGQTGQEPYNGENHRYFQKFITLLKGDLPHTRKVIDYGKKMGITARKLSSICHSFSGKSPKALINEYLISEAKRLLTDATYSVKQVALQLGFSDQYQFSTYFKQHEYISHIFFRKNRLN